MTPTELARELHEELDDLCEDEGWTLVVERVVAPGDLSPDQRFSVHLRRGSGEALTARLSAGLVAAYFADEEAAVDQMKAWIYDLAR